MSDRLDHNYLKLLVELRKAHVVKQMDVALANVLHDDKCPCKVSRAYRCNCKPDVKIKGKTYHYEDYVKE